MTRLTDNQKEILREQYGMRWDGTIVDLCVRRVSNFIELQGKIIPFDTPAIRRNFNWGTHDYDYDEISEHARNMSQNHMFFIMDNLSDCTPAYWLETVREIQSGESTTELFMVPIYPERENCRLYRLHAPSYLDDCLPAGAIELNSDDLVAVESLCLTELAKFEKRLFSYLKRYGLSKCTFTTYWADC